MARVRKYCGKIFSSGRGCEISKWAKVAEDKSQNLSLGSGALRKSLRIEITSQGLIRKGLWYDYQLCQMSDMSRWLSDVKYGRYDCQINHETSVRRLWENLWGSRIWFIRHIACLLVKLGWLPHLNRNFHQVRMVVAGGVIPSMEVEVTSRADEINLNQ